MVELKNDGNFDCVICDFGFANFISDEKDNFSFASGMRIPNTTGISIRYAAPEVT